MVGTAIDPAVISIGYLNKPTTAIVYLAQPHYFLITRNYSF